MTQLYSNFFNDIHLIKSLIPVKTPTNRPQSLNPNRPPRDPSLQTNSFWVEKSINLPSFIHTSSAKYNIINHTPNHRFFVKNVAKVKGVSHRKKAITEFCDYDRVSVSTANKVYQVS